MGHSLEDELDIPLEATLEVNHGHSWSLKTNNSSNTIEILSKTSIRPKTAAESPRCLVIGRQAKAADIRIQHGSISRKHAALYFLNNELILQDFGSKKGTFVNGKPIQGRHALKASDEIVFGAVRESVFHVRCAPLEHDNGTGSSGDHLQSEMKESPSSIKSVKTVPEHEAGVGLSGRAKREAEIAAMMESLEGKPTYQKYAPSTADVADLNPSKRHPLIANENQGGIMDENLDEITRKAQQYKLPILERMTMETESERRHVVTCIGMDPSGARFSIGTTDNTLRLYDFGGMDRIRRDPFKMLEADEGHAVADICYSNTGDRILVATGSLQPYVLDRDGGEIIKFVRGDMYVVDQSKTTGHTAAVTGCAWHPLERDLVLTSSLDGSARLWNLNGKTQFQMLVCDKVFQPKSARGQRTGVKCVAFHPAGREFVVGTSCGSIQVWNTSRVSGRPERAVYDAHGQGKAVNSIIFSQDGSRLASRSVDDSDCNVWDARRLSRSASPLALCTNVPTHYEQCRAAFSPDGTMLCVGTSSFASVEGQNRSEVGGLRIFNIPKSSTALKSPLNAFLSIDFTVNAGITVALWHPKLNQIFLGCSDGKTEILFDPRFSTKGALLPFGRASRQTDGLSELLRSRAPTGSAAVRGQIIAPNAQPIGQGTKRKRQEKDEDPSKLRQPEAPGAGFKTGGTQSGAAVNFTQFVVDSRMKGSKEIAGKDPREELLKYKEGKSYIGQAYAGNKEVILADKTVEQEEEEQE